MRRKELVEPTGTYWGDEPVHRFHHVLIRDAAYRRLLKTTRAELHERVGEWTDATRRNVIGEHETAIAFHYEQAHRYRAELGIARRRHRPARPARRRAAAASPRSRALGRDDLAVGRRARAPRARGCCPTPTPTTAPTCCSWRASACSRRATSRAGAPLVDELDARRAADDAQLGAWAACFRGPARRPHRSATGSSTPRRSRPTAAETLAELGDGAGEAKAHQVRAGLLARLGRVGEAEVVLDLALGAARAADDRRRVTAVLGAAPQAALFGPSPVARAGGRCLDVVRLLRITTASPSVEATSMRCQAVLEALRGRFDVVALDARVGARVARGARPAPRTARDRPVHRAWSS